MQNLYKDSQIEVNETEVIINNYYFPSGKSKHIQWQEIKSITVKPLTFFSGAFKLWGMGIKPYWFNYDHRTKKKHMLVIDTGHFIKSAITPDRFDLAKEVLLQKLATFK